MDCRLSGLFGTPGQGAHALRVGGLAAVDLLATGGLALAIVGPRRATDKKGAAAVLAVFVLLLAASVVVHEGFRVNTRLTAALFSRPWPGPHPACRGPAPG